MQIIDAQRAGIKAFEAGKGRAPALNNDFVRAACDQSAVPVATLCGEYMYGWDIAQLAKNAMPGAPSLVAYKNILKGIEA